jgi:hypothetical protein
MRGVGVAERVRAELKTSLYRPMVDAAVGVYGAEPLRAPRGPERVTDSVSEKRPDVADVVLESFDEVRTQRNGPLAAAFAVAHEDLAALEIKVREVHGYALADSQASAVKKLHKSAVAKPHTAVVGGFH